MAAIGSDAKQARPNIAAASSVRRGDPKAVGPDVFVRDASHYTAGGQVEQ